MKHQRQVFIDISLYIFLRGDVKAHLTLEQVSVLPEFVAGPTAACLAKRRPRPNRVAVHHGQAKVMDQAAPKQLPHPLAARLEDVVLEDLQGEGLQEVHEVIQLPVASLPHYTPAEAVVLQAVKQPRGYSGLRTRFFSQSLHARLVV